ncbi:hypothetical protein [Xanthomonas hortorum]|uniref:hypothetical protein n=1 Tax=Xanthomonas hortorum TaxID=56454 RepID=UPI0012DB47A9|nr:hypothetical protein [Xanthomonas hortorum]
MTTNVLDNNSKRLASDSRWSLLIGGHLVYVDDTGFDKIADRASAGMICAGDAQLIGAWKEWFLARDQIDLPPTERRLSNGALSPICVTIISKPGFTIDFSSGNYHAYQNLALFCGSCASSAMACFSVNKCSTQVYRERQAA